MLWLQRARTARTSRKRRFWRRSAIRYKWYENFMGGYLVSPELTRQMRTAVCTKQRFRNLVSPEEAFGLKWSPK